MKDRLAEADWPSPEIQAEISALLRGRGGPGRRAGIALRKYPEVFAGFSVHAKLAYRHLTDMMGIDEDEPDSIAVPMKVIARWLGCSTRYAQMAIQELTRRGPFPLLWQEIGSTGRVSRYRFIEDPFGEARRQAQIANRIKESRQPRLVTERNAAVIAHHRQEMTEGELVDALRAAEGRAKWALPTRRLAKSELAQVGRRFRP